MLNRCLSPQCAAFHFYGARGISVCKRWMNFDNFLEDMGSKPFQKATIERKDSNGGYCPENCRWATQKEQARNTRANRVLTLNGQSKCLAAWAEDLGVPASRVWIRKKLGWSDEDALLIPRDEKILEFNNQRKPMRTWAKELGIGYRTIWFRLNKGWSIEKALTTPPMTHSEAGKLCKKNHDGEEFDR